MSTDEHSTAGQLSTGEGAAQVEGHRLSKAPRFGPISAQPVIPACKWLRLQSHLGYTEFKVSPELRRSTVSQKKKICTHFSNTGTKRQSIKQQTWKAEQEGIHLQSQQGRKLKQENLKLNPHVGNSSRLSQNKKDSEGRRPFWGPLC